MPERAFYSVIPAGGSGTRLWPLSRAGNPKFLHALTGSSASLLQSTVTRLRPLSSPDRMYVVTGAAHAAAVARQLPELPDSGLLVEPAPRDSCAAIGLAAALIARRDPEAVMGSFAADHLIQDEAAFQATIRAAAAGADEGLLMTVGITPTHPETGYGYLQCGALVGPGPVQVVSEFKEKPAIEVAEAYLASGRYLWNASMFVWRVDVFLAELRRHQPELAAGLDAIAAAWGTPEQDAVLGSVWPGLPKISVDHAVMEGAAANGQVATVPGDFGWTDVGDFHTLGEVLARDEAALADRAGNVVIGEGKDAAILVDAGRCLVVEHSGRLVALVGVADLIVVDTPDALLVCHRGQAQDIKHVVTQLQQRGDERHL
ncbi:MAG TPA: sugar phosphate nucleotidyltransferase [Micromonosporaceae bacterium]